MTWRLGTPSPGTRGGQRMGHLRSCRLPDPGGRGPCPAGGISAGSTPPRPSLTKDLTVPSPMPRFLRAPRGPGAHAVPCNVPHAWTSPAKAARDVAPIPSAGPRQEARPGRGDGTASHPAAASLGLVRQRKVKVGIITTHSFLNSFPVKTKAAFKPTAEAPAVTGSPHLQTARLTLLRCPLQRIPDLHAGWSISASPSVPAADTAMPSESSLTESFPSRLSRLPPGCGSSWRRHLPAGRQRPRSSDALAGTRSLTQREMAVSSGPPASRPGIELRGLT